MGIPVECGTWINPPGYGDLWNCIAELELPGTFNVSNGCTVFFDPRYDTECKYDYFYLEMYDGSQWVELALFNATSNNPGGECGTPGGGNPDYWGNTDSNRLVNCDWQTRSVSGEPAFKAEIDPGTYSYTAGPRFRWRFESDGAWSDADGRGNTDGAAFVDNVWVYGDTEQYTMDFESGLDANWSFPDPDGLIDQWHMVYDPDPPYDAVTVASRPRVLWIPRLSTEEGPRAATRSERPGETAGSTGSLLRPYRSRTRVLSFSTTSSSAPRKSRVTTRIPR
jgi:hypothetical protein